MPGSWLEWRLGWTITPDGRNIVINYSNNEDCCLLHPGWSVPVFPRPPPPPPPEPCWQLSTKLLLTLKAELALLWSGPSQQRLFVFLSPARTTNVNNIHLATFYEFYIVNKTRMSYSCEILVKLLRHFDGNEKCDLQTVLLINSVTVACLFLELHSQLKNTLSF